MSEPYWVPLGAAPLPSAVPYAVLRDEKPQGTNPGASVVGWQRRDLNVKAYDDGIVTLGGNQFTLGAGSYRIFASAPHAAVAAQTRLRLRNMTDGVVVLIGTVWFPTSGNVNEIPLRGQFTVVGSKVFELQHYCGAASVQLGQPQNEAGTIEVYSVVELWKIG